MPEGVDVPKAAVEKLAFDQEVMGRVATFIDLYKGNPHPTEADRLKTSHYIFGQWNAIKEAMVKDDGVDNRSIDLLPDLISIGGDEKSQDIKDMVVDLASDADHNRADSRLSNILFGLMRDENWQVRQIGYEGAEAVIDSFGASSFRLMEHWLIPNRDRSMWDLSWLDETKTKVLTRQLPEILNLEKANPGIVEFLYKQMRVYYFHTEPYIRDQYNLLNDIDYPYHTFA